MTSAQKAFSKLRSAIGGLYFYRLGVSKVQPENQRLLREAEFALKQSFAFCPYSPEAVFKLVNLLVNKGELANAKEIVKTAELFDPENGSLPSLMRNLDEIERTQGTISRAATAPSEMAELQAQYKADPANLQTLLKLGTAYVQSRQTNEALAIFDQMLKVPTVDANTVLTIANVFQQYQNLPGMEKALEKLVSLMPENPNAWYDLARIQAVLQRPAALSNLAKSFQANDAVRAKDPAAADLRASAETEPLFARLRATPEYSALKKP